MKTGNDTESLLARIRNGDGEALETLFTLHRVRLVRMVQLRMDRRLRGRIDASDVIQETHVEAIQRLKTYLDDPKMPFFLWLRFLTRQKLAQLHRHHLEVQGRDVRKEVRLHEGPLPQATSAAIARQLMGKATSPSDAAVRAEMRIQLESALNCMDPTDREILALRHFEQLSNAEAAEELGLNESAASKRFMRATKKLTAILSVLPGGDGGLSA